MKICTRCGIESDNFSPDKKNKDGLFSWCRKCSNDKIKEYFKTKKGLSARMYGDQRQTSKRRGHPMPSYSKVELRIWLYSQDNFETLYSNWVVSGYSKKLVPSIDRLDDYKPYTLDNIQLMTWQENEAKGHRDRKNGINNKDSKSVIGTHIETGEIVEFHSIREAERQTGINHGSISQCCKGRVKYAGGYIWRYI